MLRRSQAAGDGACHAQESQCPRLANRGDRTESPDIAQRWAIPYVDLAKDDTHRAQLGEAPRYPDAIDSTLEQGWVDRLAVQGYAPGTVGFYIWVVRGYFRAVSSGALDPTHEVNLTTEGERDVRAWTDDEIEQLRKAADTLDADRPARSSATWGIAASYRRCLELGGGCTALVLPEWWASHRSDLSGRVLLRPGISACGSKVVGAWMTAILDRAKLNTLGEAAHSLRHTYSRFSIEKGGRLEEL